MMEAYRNYSFEELRLMWNQMFGSSTTAQPRLFASTSLFGLPASGSLLRNQPPPCNPFGVPPPREVFQSVVPGGKDTSFEERRLEWGENGGNFARAWGDPIGFHEMQTLNPFLI
ncbi:hypothetical protein FRC02_011045 [Tulasnella sp. 418]|nr:hypothetical protein FRC02_011045 [Tulasnella sp. 418]